MNTKPVDAEYMNPNGYDLLYYKFESGSLMVYDPRIGQWVKTPLNKQIVLDHFKRISG